MTVYILADDLTGANDTVVRFAEVGAGSVSVLDINRAIDGLKYQAQALVLDSRKLSPESAYRKNRELTKRLLLAPGDLIYKKIDSTLRGNIGVEIEGVLDGLSDHKIALVAPALPENHRITVDGYQLINQIPVHESELANDPVAPVRCSHLPRILTQNCRRKVGWLSLEEVTNGIIMAEKCLNRLISDGCRIIAADAAQHQHLETLARLIIKREDLLPCGSAGLAGALAGGLFTAQRVIKEEPIKGHGIMLAVIGSKTSVSRLQIQRAIENLDWVGGIAVDPSKLENQTKQRLEILRIVSTLEHLLSAGKQGVIIYFAKEREAGRSLDPYVLAKGLGVIAGNLVKAAEPRVLYVSGGDIAASVAGALGCWGIEINGQLEPGICCGCLLTSANSTKLKVISKAGSFGDADTLLRVFGAWYDKK